MTEFFYSHAYLMHCVSIQLPIVKDNFDIGCRSNLPLCVEMMTTIVVSRIQDSEVCPGVPFPFFFFPFLFLALADISQSKSLKNQPYLYTDEFALADNILVGESFDHQIPSPPSLVLLMNLSFPAIGFLSKKSTLCLLKAR